MRLHPIFLLFVLGCAPASAPDAGPDSPADDLSVSDTAAPTDAAGDDAPAVDAPDAPSSDAPSSDAPSSSIDGGASDLRACPTSGDGAVSGGGCLLLTPIETGLPAAGGHADDDHYALRPRGAARGRLLVYIPASGGWPAVQIASPDTNWYAAGADAGLHVLALAYRSDDVVGIACRMGGDPCYLAMRQSLLDGTYHTGAPRSLETIDPGEGIYTRLHAALVHLAAHDPAGGWGAYFDPAVTDPQASIRWDLLFVSGHSQGGGHAALIGRDHSVARVITLSSPCDGTAAPAAWLSDPSTFTTDPSAAFYGLGSTDDPICALYDEIWAALGVDPSRRGEALDCTGVRSPHSRSILCAENATLWAGLLGP